MLLATEPTTLQVVWYLLIAVLWIGYLVLEGFDYGVAMLIRVLGKNEKERRVIVNTIGPLWDGNEVWLLTAGGATFAAFPGWYATLFSGLYLPLFLILLGLIVRGVAFEYRAKNPDAAWRSRFDLMAAVGSFVVALVFGVGFANFIIGLPVEMAPGSQHLYVFSGGFWSLFSPFALLCGVVLVVLFLFHGANFIALKTRGVVHDRAEALAAKIGLGAIAGGAVYLLWANLAYGIGVIGWLLTLVAAGALIGSWVATRAGRDGWAFVGTTLAILAVAVWIFVRMWPNLGFDNSAVEVPLDRVSAASTELTLSIMTGAAVVFVPIVLVYQAWSIWVFRKRISTKNIPDDVSVAA
ncbi:cytochrome d ubiquinol oxidase subunit II [Propioniciclava sp.]|uniref:cytochrome d ubiquinol oxidase subunit II n=1 Tax=Propioniciclava sp. TaxID=2038686 RepID=UPI00260E5000|nr:cytochrome d ubiquinol oxidase subunit II [Propioniciclava sp.]